MRTDRWIELLAAGKADAALRRQNRPRRARGASRVRTGCDGRPYSVNETVDRKAIPLAVRSAVFARDGHRCQVCSTTTGPFHLDHLVPWSAGGPDTADNLRVLCAPCNLRRGAGLVPDAVLAERAS